jgi:hypothetical protein
MSATHFRLTTRDGRPVPRATPVPSGHAHRTTSTRCRWPLVVATHVGCPPPPLTTALSPTSPFPSHHSAVLLAALLHTSRYYAHRCPSPMSCLELSDQAKRSTSSPRPSCTESLPAVPAGEAGPRDFPVIVFLHERHTSGSLLYLFPLFDDPAAISAPPRSSSPTSSSTTSTTPSVPHRRPLPINTCATAEASSQ